MKLPNHGYWQYHHTDICHHIGQAKVCIESSIIDTSSSNTLVPGIRNRSALEDGCKTYGNEVAYYDASKNPRSRPMPSLGEDLEIYG